MSKSAFSILSDCTAIAALFLASSRKLWTELSDKSPATMKLRREVREILDTVSGGQIPELCHTVSKHLVQNLTFSRRFSAFLTIYEGILRKKPFFSTIMGSTVLFRMGVGSARPSRCSFLKARIRKYNFRNFRRLCSKIQKIKGRRYRNVHPFFLFAMYIGKKIRQMRV